MFTAGGEETGGKRAQDSEGGCFLVALLRSFLAGDAHQPTIGPTLVCRCQILPHNFRIFHPGSVGFGRPTLSPRGERRFLSSNSQPTNRIRIRVSQ